MENIFIEENGVYSIDCRTAVWATDKMHVLKMLRILMLFIQWKKRKYLLQHENFMTLYII